MEGCPEKLQLDKIQNCNFLALSGIIWFNMRKPCQVAIDHYYKTKCGFM